MEELKYIKNKYRQELIKFKKNINKMHSDIKSLEDIDRLIESSKYYINDLDGKSKKFKLVDRDYKQFKYSMGHLVIGLNKAEFLGMSEEKQNDLAELILELHHEFKEIENKNTMRDYDVWS